MYKYGVAAVFLCVAQPGWSAEPVVLSAALLKAKVVEITTAQNQVMLKGSNLADIDRLFALYSDNFVYRHDAYGGEYSKAELYANTVRLQSQGRYNNAGPRYLIQELIPGYNAIAVERQEIVNGKAQNHLAVFEFDGDKVSRIIEYWK